MKKLFTSTYLFVLIALVIGMSSCGGNKPEHEKIMPNDAAGVIIINNPGLMKKVAWNSIQNLKVFETMNLFSGDEEATTETGKLFQKADENGIDIQEKVYVGFYKSESDSYIASFFNLKDPAALEKYLGSVSKQTTEIAKYKTAVLDTTVMIGWQKNNLVVIIPVGKDKGQKFIEKIAAVKPETSITSNEEFKKLQDSDNDISIIVDTRQLKNAGLSNIDPELFNVRLNIAINFNNGDMEVRATQITEGSAYEKYSGLTKPTPAYPDLSHIDGSKINGVAGVSVNLKKVFELYKNEIDAEIRKMGFTPEELTALFKGDLIVSLDGFNEVTKTYTVYDYDEDFNMTEKQETRTDQIPMITLNLAVSDEKSAIAFLDKSAGNGMLKKEGDRYILDSPGMKVYAFAKGNSIYITNDSLFYSNPGAKFDNLAPEVTTSMKTESVILYADVNRLSKVPFEKGGDHIKRTREQAEPFVKYVRAVSLTGKEIPGEKKYETTFHIYFNDKDENSLLQIIKLSKDLKAKKTNATS